MTAIDEKKLDGALQELRRLLALSEGTKAEKHLMDALKHLLRAKQALEKERE